MPLYSRIARVNTMWMKADLTMHKLRKYFRYLGVKYKKGVLEKPFKKASIEKRNEQFLESKQKIDVAVNIE